MSKPNTKIRLVAMSRREFLVILFLLFLLFGGMKLADVIFTAAQ